MNKTIETAFNDHLNAELFSSYLYLSMANYFAAENLEGMAQWMRIQVEEERIHALKFLDFINERGGRVTLGQIDQPKLKWQNALNVFEEAYAHECMISGKINDLLDVAREQSDHAAAAFLQWFISEQVEEEATALAIVGKLKLVGDHSMGLLMMDQQLAQRVPSAPDPAAQ